MVGEWNGTRSSDSLHIACFSSDPTPLLQLGDDMSRSQLSIASGEPGPSNLDPGPSDLDAGPSDLSACEEQHLGGDDFQVPSPEPPPSANEAGRSGQHNSIEPDPLEQEPTDDDPGAAIRLPNLQVTQGFIDELGVASLENSAMQSEDIESIRDPGPVLDLEDPSPLLRSLRHFVNNSGSSRAHYESIREIELLNNPSDGFLSFDQAKRRLRWLSGVVPLEHDMCPNTCIAYTGPYKELNMCPRCPLSWYFPNSTTPRKRFTTVPIGPVIQAFYGSHDIAGDMHYLDRALSSNVDRVQRSGGNLDKYDDITCGKDVISAWTSGALRKDDVALQISIDGAQL